MRTKKFVLNSLFAAINQIVVLLVGLVLPRVFISTYGSEINGMVTSISQFISYLSLIEAGLGAAAIYALYKPIAEENYSEINALVYSTKKYYMKTAIIFSILVVVLSLIYPLLVDSETMSFFEITVMVLVLGAGGVIELSTMSKYRVLLTADQRIYVLSIASMVATLVNFLIIYILCIYDFNVILVKAIALSTYFLRTYILFHYIKKRYPLVTYKNISGKPIVIKNRGNALFAQMVAVFSISIPTIAVTLTSGLKEVSVFSIYNMVSAGCIMIISIFTTGMSATFGNLIAKREDTLVLERYSQFEFIIYSILTIIYTVFLVLIIPFVEIYSKGFTDINYVVTLYGILFPIWGLAHNVRIPHDTIVTAAGKFKEIKYLNIMQLIMLLIIPYIAGIYWGISGILVSMIIINIQRNLYLLVYVSRNVIPISMLVTIGRIIRMIITIIIFYLVFHDFVYQYISTFWSWVVAGFIVFIFTTIFVLLINFIFEKNEMKMIFKIFSNFLKTVIKKNDSSSLFVKKAQK